MLIATAATAAAASIGTAPAPRPPDAALVRSVEAVLFDCDGVIYANKRAVPGVPETLARLRGAGKRLFFVTNAAAASRERRRRCRWWTGARLSCGVVAHLASTSR